MTSCGVIMATTGSLAKTVMINSTARMAPTSSEAEKYCTELFDKSVNMGPYTPYGMVPSLVFPGSEGGGGWGGAAGSPSLGLVFVNTELSQAHLHLNLQAINTTSPPPC